MKTKAETQIKDDIPLRHCVICGSAVVHKYRPFCSSRCSSADLWHWLNEDYSLADDKAKADDGESD